MMALLPLPYSPHKLLAVKSCQTHLKQGQPLVKHSSTSRRSPLCHVPQRPPVLFAQLQLLCSWGQGSAAKTGTVLSPVKAVAGPCFAGGEALQVGKGGCSLLPWPQTQIRVAGVTMAGCALPADHPLCSTCHLTITKGGGLFSGMKAARKR